MHTESEAEKLWCPFARVQVGYDGAGGGAFAAVNRTWDWIRKHLGWETDDDESEVCNCIASKCMQWEWEPLEQSEERQTAYEDSFNIGGIDSRDTPERRGDCGLKRRQRD